MPPTKQTKKSSSTKKKGGAARAPRGKKNVAQKEPEEMEAEVIEEPQTYARKGNKRKATKDPKKQPKAAATKKPTPKAAASKKPTPKAAASKKPTPKAAASKKPTPKAESSKKPKPKTETKKPKSKAKATNKKVQSAKPQPVTSPGNFQGRDQASELKFGCFEVVVAAVDLDASEPQDKFLIGRLQEDLWMGSDKDEELMISWFDRSEDDEGVWEAEDVVDLIPAGSLVCSVNKFVKEGIKYVKEGDDKGNYEILHISKKAFEYAEKKLNEQLQDDYESDNDSQFGDAAVFKRLAYHGVGGRRKAVAMEIDRGDNEEPGQKRKRKGGAAGAKKKARSQRGLTPRPTFRMATDPFTMKTGKIGDYDGDMERASREVVRAVRSGDLKALKVALKSNKIATMHYRQSTAVPITPLMWALVQGDKDAVMVLMEDLKERMDAKRPSFQRCALPKLTTGRISGKHANYNRRSINASRGGREGNNALLYDAERDSYKTDNMDSNHLGEKAMPLHVEKEMPDSFDWNILRDFDEITAEILDLAETKFDRSPVNDDDTRLTAIDDVVRAGHRKMLERLIKLKKDHAFDPNSFNFLHLESLADAPKDPSKPFSKDILARSVAKKADYSDSRFSPLACACINPNTVFLKAMLSVAPEHAQLLDAKDTSLMHYAAACEGPEPLAYLIETHSLSRTAIDKRKETPIHYAARAGRPHNVKVLLDGVDPELASNMLKAKSSQGYSAIHYAVQTRRSGGLATLQALVEAGADVNLPTTAARNKVMPMHIAAALGDSDALNLLVKHGGSIMKGDKLGRTPLIHACINGQAHIVSQLLIAGVNAETADSSENQPVHYAAAYGWDECVGLLLEAGVNPDAKNSWKTTPLSVAIQKGRHQVSTRLLKLASVDANYKDDDGKTLFFRLVETYVATTLLSTSASSFPGSDEKTNNKKRGGDDEETNAVRKELPWALQKLLDRDDLDVASTDPGGVNILHLLCSQDYPSSGFGQVRAVALAKLILGVGKIDLDASDADGMSPLIYAAVAGNALLFEFLLREGATLSESTVDKDGKNICHHLVGVRPHKCEAQLQFVEKSVGGDVFAKLLSAADKEGFNPIHRAFIVMVESLGSEKDYNTAHSLLRGLVTRFPDLAVAKVGPTEIFDNPTELAKILSDEEEYMGQAESYRPRRLNQNRRGPQVLSGADRLVGKHIRDSLSNRNVVVPVVGEHFGKSIVHLACASKHPFRTRGLLEWLIPLSGEVLGHSGGRAPDNMTPLQVLLYKILPAALIPDKPVPPAVERRSSDEQRRQCLHKLLESVSILIEATGGDINSELPCPFADEEDRKKSENSFSEEMDSELVKVIKRLVASVNGKDSPESGSPESGPELVEAFRDLMSKRDVWRQAKSNQTCFPEPLTIVLAKLTSSRVSVDVWEELVSKCGLDLAGCNRSGDSALHVALRQRDDGLSRYLCKANSQLVSLPNKQGERPIHVVAKGDDPKFVKLVLENVADKGAETNEGDDLGRTAFHFSVEKAANRHGQPLEQCEIILLRAGARLDVADTRNKRTPLHFCFLDGASNPHDNFPHDLGGQEHDRVDLVSTLLAAKGADKAVTMADDSGRTPLFYAAAYNSTVSSLLLVSKGAGLFETDKDGNTPVNVAILRGHDSYAITMLKSMGAASNLPELVDVVDIRRVKDGPAGQMKVISRSAKSIVWHAIKRNFRGLVYILLDTSFPLYRAAVDALNLRSFQLVRKLLTTSPPEVVRYVNPETGYSLLHEVAAVNTFADVEWSTTLAEILLESGVLPCLAAKDGQSALHVATTKGHTKLIQLLVATDKKIVSIVDKDGMTALHIASVSGSVSLIQLMVAADKTVVSTVDKDGHLPLGRFMRALPRLGLDDVSCIRIVESLTSGVISLSERKHNQVPRTKKQAKEITYSGITFAPGPNRDTVAEEISRRKTAAREATKDDNRVDGFSTLLIQAMTARKWKLMQKLIRRGSSIDMVDSGGLSPLHHAVLSNSYRAAVLLLRNGADPNVLSEDARGVTPLVTAVFQSGSTGRALDLIKLLLRYGADLTPACKQSGGTALHFACRENNLEQVRLLMRAALHSGAKAKKPKKKRAMRNGEALVRFRGDCALFPAKIDAGTVEVYDPEKSVLPASLVEESFVMSDFSLDSLEALVALKLKLDDESSESTKPSAQGIHAKKTSAENTLRKYYGLESLLLGETDENLTAPIAKGSPVIVQLVTVTYANARDMWLEGRVLEVWGNGTYDVDLWRGTVVEGVTRQSLRPWKASKVAWPAPGAKQSETLDALFACRDKEGQTPLQAAVKPTDFGSYENVRLIDALVDHGAVLDADTVALCRPGSKLEKHLAELSKDAMDLSDSKEESIPTNPDGLEPIPSGQLERESKAALISLEQKGVLKRKQLPPEILPACEMKAVGRRVLPVVKENEPSDYGDSGKHYGVVMAKVELTHHGHSENKYYKMQIVEDPTKGLFVLVTNWGQVGDYGGQKQQTPFGSRDEAVKEFTKVFKSKSGNLWDDYLAGSFEPKLSKYKPLKLLTKGFEKPGLPNLAYMVAEEEDYPDVVRTSALSTELTETMSAFVDPVAINRATAATGLQQERLPLGKISIETILEAEEKLKEIEQALKRLSQSKDDVKEKRQAQEEVAILSSQYFELLPTKEGDNALRPLNASSLKQEKAHIMELKDLTVASQIITTASVKATELHPLDYAYRAMNAHMSALSTDTAERIGVEQYFRNTAASGDLVVNQVYKLHRMEEKSNRHMENRRLLWHGTQTANMLGVIKEGLRVAPPTAQHAGNAFGNGVYFADMASKSWNYCRARFDSNAKDMPRAYLLLADVALGRQEKVTDANWGETQTDPEADSVWAIGYQGPDVSKDMVFAETGTIVPLGENCRVPSFQPKAEWKKGRYCSNIDSKLVDAIEEVRNSRDTKFPAVIRGDVNGTPVDIHIEHGKHSSVAKVVTVRVEKESGETNKKQKGNDGKAVEKDEAAEDGDEEEEDTWEKQEYEITRGEKSLSGHIHYNEYIVSDTDRINLRYIVEVTSRAWLENQAKKAKATLVGI